jgi:hypothetical protein
MKDQPDKNSEPSIENESTSEKDREQQEKFPGYPPYPPEDDIFVKGIEESELDPENPTKLKSPPEPADAPSEKDFPGNVSGDDLDVPGAELDDKQEKIGSEDEENNLYSLGGDNHDDVG